MIDTYMTVQRPTSGSSSTAYGIIAFSHLRWDFVWQRPQQFLSRFAKRHKVLFVEEPFYDLAPAEEPNVTVNKVADNVWVASAHMPSNLVGTDAYEAVASTLIGKARDIVNTDGSLSRPLLWFYNPSDSLWALDSFAARGVVYDCMDELSQFAHAPAHLVAGEQKLLNRADVVFTGGYELLDRKSKHHSNAHVFGCGVEYDHFAQAQLEGQVPEDLRDLSRPRLGWFGVIDERFDIELLRGAAKLRPDWAFVLIGPVVKIDPATLPRDANIHYLGQKSYGELPSYCRGFDACIMPFALNEATEFINPTKALEYLATGKPVISTAVKDVVKQYAGLIDLVSTPEELVAICEERMREQPDEQRLKGILKARSCSWDSTVASMQQIIDQAISQRASGTAEIA